MRTFLVVMPLVLVGCAGQRPPSATAADSAAGQPAPPRQVDAHSMQAELERKQYEEDMARSRSDFIGRNQRP